MQLNVLTETKGVLKLELTGETHTLANLLREQSWLTGATQAAYAVDHPSMSQPVITIRGPNPKKTLSEAATRIAEQSNEFSKAFSRATKK